MANLKDIRRRIASVKGTQKITSAMKMVAAAKLRKAQEKAEHFKAYSSLTTEVLAEVAREADEDAHPLLARRPVKRSLLLVISSDRGLCGGFNSNLNRMVQQRRTQTEQAPDLCVAGKKSKQYFAHRQVELVNYYEDIFDNLSFERAAAIAAELAAWYTDGTYDEISLAYNVMESVVSQVPTVVPLLPIALPDAGEKETSTELEPAGFIFEPDGIGLLATLLPAYVETRVFAALLESNAAEHAARMSAMETATNNAQDMIDSLTLVYNRARQSAITSELMDIVGGAEALND